MVDGPPQVHPFASDPHHHPVQVPLVARARTAPSQPPRDHRSELQHPAPDGSVRDIETTAAKEILDVSIAESETQVEPDRMLNDSRGIAVAAV